MRDGVETGKNTGRRKISREKNWSEVSFRICHLEIRPLLRERSCIQSNMAAPLFASPRKNKWIFPSTRRSGIILKFLPGVYPVTNALTIGIYYYINVALNDVGTCGVA